MKKLFHIIEVLTPNYDKLAHVYWGFIYAIIGLLIGRLIDFYHLTYILPLALGTIKEYYDYKDYGKFDLLDLIFTIAPGVIIYFMI